MKIWQKQVYSKTQKCYLFLFYVLTWLRGMTPRDIYKIVLIVRYYHAFIAQCKIENATVGSIYILFIIDFGKLVEFQTKN